MANPEHIEILKQGVDVWNRWRAENVEIKPDLSGRPLSESDLLKINLSDTILRWSSLNKCDLTEADFSRADLSGAKLRESNFSNANFEYAFFELL